jgi:hypothetical protein
MMSAESGCWALLAQPRRYALPNVIACGARRKSRILHLCRNQGDIGYDQLEISVQAEPWSPP